VKPDPDHAVAESGRCHRLAASCRRIAGARHHRNPEQPARGGAGRRRVLRLIRRFVLRAGAPGGRGGERFSRPTTRHCCAVGTSIWLAGTRRWPYLSAGPGVTRPTSTIAPPSIPSSTSSRPSGPSCRQPTRTARSCFWPTSIPSCSLRCWARCAARALWPATP
jgi:hypothetical protein